MNFGLQMWLEIKVNTGRERRHFRFVPCEAESAKAEAEGDVFALFNETPRGSFPKGRNAFQSRKEMPRPPGKFEVRVRMQRFRPLSRVIHNPTTLWPGGSCQSPPTTLAGDMSLLEGSLQDRRTGKIPITRSTLWVSFIQKDETGRCSGKKQGTECRLMVCLFLPKVNQEVLLNFVGQKTRGP